MSGPRSEPPFLERQTYRRRRLMDAARLLPIVGAIFFALPLLWAGGTAQSGAASTAQGGLYVFIIWGGLILCAVLMARPLARSDAPGRGGGASGAGGIRGRSAGGEAGEHGTGTAGMVDAGPARAAAGGETAKPS
ncbi:hypothetical protein [Profundibacterium mesophilum]|uniref:Uncharacterized protein n=1 Tax=Profundibacterium mesophilum KAUST100406-0324 TaxID=1037889 RepID=A0A921NT35_9RHOB|nr:hypothetical protein [Profundibacterium mesophilum]KAF0675010.1 hypothetical protein PMES_02719 [Profundibacterium mesophilum KAUST100406-0324]